MARKAYNLEMAMEKPEEVEELSLYRNKYSKFPPDFSQFKNLRKLDFSKNNFTEIPQELYEFQKLESLNFNDNQISTIDFDFSKLPNLTSLSLRKNNFQVLPKEIFLLRELTLLDLSGNAIKKIPAAISKLANLKRLNLSDNQIRTLPDSIIYLRNLEYLNLENNILKDFPAGTNQWSNLLQLKLDFDITEKTLFELSKIETLNHLHLANHNNSFLKSTQIFPKNAWKGLMHLTIQGIGKIPPFVFQCSQLRRLILIGFDDEILSNRIEKLKYLTYFEIDNYFLKQLPKSFINLDNLWEVKFPNAPFEGIPTSLLQLKNLKRLSLKKKLNAKRVLKFISVCNKQNLPVDFRKIAYEIALGNGDAIKNISKKNIFFLLNFSFQNLENNVRKCILNYHNLGLERYPLQNKTHLSILGKTNFDLNKVKNHLKNANRKITPQTTHIVLGKLPSEIENLTSRDFVFVPETEINRWLQSQEQPYLFNSTDEEIENLSRLLLSLQPENIDIALQVMEAGGVPEKILTDLVITFKKLAPCKQKRAIRKLLAINLSEQALQVVSLKTGLLKKAKLTLKIKQLTVATELNGEKIIDALICEDL